MDPTSPVSGVTLEQYAALSAEIAACRGDASKVTDILARGGLSAADWELAQAGWAARLTHPGMGAAIALRFEALYHEALDRLLGPTPDVPSADFAALWGEALALGLPAMWQERHLDPLAWSRISHRCRVELSADPARLAAALAIAQLVAERRVLGPAQPAHARTPSSRPPPPTDGAADPKAAPDAAKPIVQKFDQDATVAAKAVGKAVLSGLDAFGAAMDGFGKTLLRPSVGAPVTVQWSDGKRYPGTVAKVGEGQLLVTMGDGSQHWIPDAYVKSV